MFGCCSACRTSSRIGLKSRADSRFTSPRSMFLHEAFVSIVSAPDHRIPSPIQIRSSPVLPISRWRIRDRTRFENGFRIESPCARQTILFQPRPRLFAQVIAGRRDLLRQSGAAVVEQKRGDARRACSLYHPTQWYQRGTRLKCRGAAWSSAYPRAEGVRDFIETPPQRVTGEGDGRMGEITQNHVSLCHRAYAPAYQASAGRLQVRSGIATYAGIAWTADRPAQRLRPLYNRPASFEGAPRPRHRPGHEGKFSIVKVPPATDFPSARGCRY